MEDVRIYKEYLCFGISYEHIKFKNLATFLVKMNRGWSDSRWKIWAARSLRCKLQRSWKIGELDGIVGDAATMQPWNTKERLFWNSRAQTGSPGLRYFLFFFFCIVELVLEGYLAYRCASCEPFRCVTRSFSEEMEPAVLSTSVEERSLNLVKIRDIDASWSFATTSIDRSSSKMTR